MCAALTTSTHLNGGNCFEGGHQRRSHHQQMHVCQVQRCVSKSRNSHKGGSCSVFLPSFFVQLACVKVVEGSSASTCNEGQAYNCPTHAGDARPPASRHVKQLGTWPGEADWSTVTRAIPAFSGLDRHRWHGVTCHSSCVADVCALALNMGNTRGEREITDTTRCPAA